MSPTTPLAVADSSGLAASLTHFDILAARQAYQAGKNVTEVLRHQRGLSFNTPDIIETAYDLQAGTYVDHARHNMEALRLYACELAMLLDQNLSPACSLLDVGTGELTTFSLVSRLLYNKPLHLLAFDLSWSRIHKGLGFAQEMLQEDFKRLTPFVADINAIPLCDKSVDVTVSSHALEPNGSNLHPLLSELFRVTRVKLVLFEPCYEIASAEGKQRMERLGYIRDLSGAAESLGGRVLSRTPVGHISNPLNPTACFVIEPPSCAMPAAAQTEAEFALFSVPGTRLPLTKTGNFYYSRDTGLCYPILKDIPVLKTKSAILASCLQD
jgi:SAM-dependent methyltransferase